MTLQMPVDFDPRFYLGPALDLRELLHLAYGTLLETAETEALVQGIPQDGSCRFHVWVEERAEPGLFSHILTLKGQWVRTTPPEGIP